YNPPMFRVAPYLALALALAACDRDPEQPRGDAWQPCNEDKRCDKDGMICQQAWGASDVTVCSPTCSWGSDCAAPPVNDDGQPVSARCDATESSPSGICTIDCTTANDCAAGMLCFFDEVFTPATGRGICAWPPL